MPASHHFRTRALAGLLALSLSFTAPATALAQVRLPALGDASSDDFSLSAERRIGEQIMREIRRDPDYLDDPMLLEYVQSLWSPLLAAARKRGDIGPDVDAGFAWEAFLVRERSVNAFALPGGYVGVHLGLIAMTARSDELAAVLAHELSHISQRHIARSIASSSRQSLVGMAAIILGILAASRSKSPDMANAVVAGGQAAMIQGQLNFSRDMEREADRIGFGVMSGAGFAPSGVARMFEKLENANRLNDSGAFPYLRSHPLTTERIGEARARAEAVPAGDPRAALQPGLEHAAMQGRARVLMDSSAQALRRFQLGEAALQGSTAERLTGLYAGALASILLREPARADSAIASARTLLAAQTPRDARAERALALLQVQALAERGDAARALAAIDAPPGDSAALKDNSRVVLLARAQAALAVARAGGNAAALRSSTEALQTHVAERPNDAAAWSALAQGAEHLGLKLRALRAQAESHAAIGDLVGAIDRLRAGQRAARAGSPDFIEASIIDSRLRELQTQRRQELADARNERGGSSREPPQE